MGHNFDVCAGGCYDEWRGRCIAGSAADVGVVAWNNHAHDQHSQEVEEGDSSKDALTSLWYVLARILRLGCGDGERFDAVEGIDCVVDDGPEAEKLAPASAGDVGNKGARVVPVSETDSLLSWYSSEIDAEAHDDNADDEQDLENGKEEFDFSVDADEYNCHCKCYYKENGNPYCRTQIGPVFNQDD